MLKHRRLRQTAVIITAMTLIMNIVAPITTFASDTGEKTVRVGWHEPPYFIKDENGRQSGYSYEYQRKVAAYTGWKYEYVEGSWSDLLQKLKDGEIDVMSNVSYSEERANDILFSSLPMGTEAYYIFVSPDNTEITADNISSLNGKKIGVTKGSIQKDFFNDWAEIHGIEADVIEVNRTDEESLKQLGKEYDAFVTIDVYGSPDTTVPICKIGSSDYYFAVSKDRPDLLPELDSALNSIQDENKYYDQQLHDKYLKSTEIKSYLSTEEKNWLAKHGTIRVGYQDNYLAFCAKDPETGELTGALKDYLKYASAAFENAEPKFEAVAYDTTADALEALQNGEIDCMFPANITDHDAEQLGLVISPPMIHTEMDAVVRASEQKEFLRKQNVTVAVNEGNTNYDIFLADHYPDWQRKYFKDTPAGLDAVAQKKADCVIISSYRYSNISKQCKKLHLTTVYTGMAMNYSFAVREGDSELYSVLATITGIIPEASVHRALTYYSTEDVKTTLFDNIKDHLFIVTTVIASVLLIIVILLLRSIRAERKVIEERKLVKSLNRKAFVDALTSVRNKGAYYDYINKLQERIDGEESFGLAIGIFDCNDLKLINDKYGHDKGDLYLKNACQLICKVFDHSPVFRIGGDEFAVILQNNDFNNRDQLIELFESRRRDICEKAANEWEEIHIAHGIAVYDPQNDDTISDTVRRADREMYENKRIIKSELVENR